MIRRLGAAGIVGVVLLLGGLALVAWRAPIVALGLGLVIAGTGLIVKGLIDAFLGSMGFGGMT